MAKNNQLSLIKPAHWNFRYNHGGQLRQKRRGRKQRPLSTKDPLHLVFKADKTAMKMSFRSMQSFRIVNKVIQRYAKKFFIKIDKMSIQKDHIHICIRLPKRAMAQHFFRVVAGQIAQQFQKQNLIKVTDTPKCAGLLRKLWMFRPYSRVVKGYRAWVTVLDYIELNEKEARGVIAYNKNRLRGLCLEEWVCLRA